MAGGRSSTASKPGSKRASRKGACATSGTGKGRPAGATARKRTVVLDGTFSIEEIEVKGRSRRKAAKTAKKKAAKKAGKKAAKKAGKKAAKKVARTAERPKTNKSVAGSVKRAAKPKTDKKVAASVKRAAKSKTNKTVAGSVKAISEPKTCEKPATAELGRVVLASVPGIKTIAELKDALQEAHSAASPVIVDVSKVESIDTAALQLLVAFANSVREQSRTVEWTELSNEFCEMAKLADLSRGLGIGDISVAEDDGGLCPVF